MRSRCLRLGRIVSATVLMLSGVAQAADGYSVTVIADGRNSLAAGWDIASSTSLNNLGDVVFLATRGLFPQTSFESMVAFGSGGALTTVAMGVRPPGIGSTGQMLNHPAINNQRQVIYNSTSGAAGVPFNGSMLWENGTSRIYMDILDGTTARAYGRGQGGLSDNARVLATCANGSGTCIAGERGAIFAFAGGQTLPDGTAYQRILDGVGAISRDGRYTAAGGSLTLFGAGPRPQSIGTGLTAVGASGFRVYVVGENTAAGPTATATAVSINNNGFASFISNRQGNGSFVGVVNTNTAASDFTRLVDLGSGFSSFGNSNRGAAINNWNEIAFLADPSGDGQSGNNVYVTHVSGGVPRAVLARGDVVTADGAVYWDAVPGTLDTHSFNDLGQVALQARLTKDGGQTTFEAIVRVDPLAGSSPGTPVLPAPVPQPPGGGWVLQPGRFVGGVAPVVRTPRRTPIWVDPDIAVGYDFLMSEGGPAIEGVIVPAAMANGDEDFELQFEGHTVALKAGARYSFTDLVAGGVSSFRLTGIDVGEGLDPNNPTAFVTGLVFGEGGLDDFSVTMKPIVVNVPEPNSVALLVAGLGWMRWRKVQLRRTE